MSNVHISRNRADPIPDIRRCEPRPTRHSSSRKAPRRWGCFQHFKTGTMNNFDPTTQTACARSPGDPGLDYRGVPPPRFVGVARCRTRCPLPPLPSIHHRLRHGARACRRFEIICSFLDRPAGRVSIFRFTPRFPRTGAVASSSLCTRPVGGRRLQEFFRRGG